jgi:PAS domain S-box-containing protein
MDRFWVIADSLPERVAYVDAGERYQFNNKSYEEWFGIGREQLKGRPVREFLGEEAYALVKPFIEKALAGQRTTFEGYVPHQLTGRHYVHIDYVPQTDPTGQIVGFYVLIQDLTELRLAEERFQAFVESAPIAMLITDPQGKITLVNSQAEHLFGYAKDELVGQELAILFPKELQARYAEHSKAYVQDPQWRPVRTGGEFTAVRKDGRRIPVEISLSAVQTSDGLRISSVISDITEHKWMEQQSRRAAVLEERNRIARDVHDGLAQGLTGIVLHLEGAEAVLDKDPEEGRRHIVRARDLARESLEEARRSLMELRPKALVEGELPAAIQRAINEITENTAVRVETVVLGTPRPLALGIQENLLRIAQEAMNNAMQHAKANEVRVELSYESNAANLRIADDGVGFETGKAGGTRGFGLSIMNERAAEMGAQFHLQSRPGEGTRVEVHVPVPEVVVESTSQ